MAKNKNLPSAHSLLLSSIKFYKKHVRQILPVASMAAVINWLLRLPGDATASLYQTIWFLFALTALIWTVRHAGDPKTASSLRQAYFVGTAAALKLVLVLAALSLATLPFSVGLFLYSAVGVVSGQSASIAEQALGIGLWVVFGTLSIYLVARLMFSVLIVSLPEMYPGLALGLSWKLSRGNALSLSAKLITVLLYSLLLIILLLLALSFTGLSAGFSQTAIEITTSVIIVPLILIYIFEIYRQLK